MRSISEISEDINENHLIVFIAQIIIAFLAFTAVFFFMAKNEPQLNSEKNYVSSIIADCKNSDEPETKTSLYDLITKGKSKREVTTTDITFDLENKIVWVNDKQQSMFETYLMSCIISSLMFILFGIGKVYFLVRRITGYLFSKYSLLALLPFAIMWEICLVLVLFTLPIALAVHFIIGVVQLIIRFKGTSASDNTAAEL